MTLATENFLKLLELEKIGDNHFRGLPPKPPRSRLFGSPILSLATMGARQTVEPSKELHSIHGYFMRAGDPVTPIDIHVDRTRDGRSFDTRHLLMSQGETPIFSMSASFHVHEEGSGHQDEMPSVPQPEELANTEQLLEKYGDKTEGLARFWSVERPLEIRPVQPEHYLTNDILPPYQNTWIKASSALPDDVIVHQCWLAYASDHSVLDTALFPYGRQCYNTDIMIFSLDHAIWFHRPFKADEWLLFSQDTPSKAAGRGFSRGKFFTREGALVASVAQEGLIRFKEER
ncbi:acyl-CoA thioesterase [Flexibacterium corallicola]|uniref:acyl-CoA thioesterase n=1 Tax=Flexibacterium corallicola TaxID=3037259 RepID=UPI00286F435A|nr:acyl-CoA thioesterase II [Pseudovibrio sp. M1P-2-3]